MADATSLRTRGLLAIAALIVSGCASGDPTPAPSGAFPPSTIDTATLPTVVPLRIVANHPLVDVTFESADPHTFMLDTGAPTTMSDALIASLGAPKVGETRTNAVGGAITTGDVHTIEDLSMGGLDVSRVAAVKGWVDADDPLTCLTENGLIGANVMSPIVWQIDYQAGTATAASSTTGLDHVDDALVTEIRTFPGYSPTPIVEIETGTGGLLFVVDTGSDGGMIAAPAALAEMGIEVPADAPRIQSRATGAAGDFDIDTRFVDVPFRLGGRDFTYPVAAFDIGTAGLGNIGNAFLSQFVVTIDWAHQMMYLDPVADSITPPKIPGASISWDGTNVVIGSLTAAGPAAQAGLALGDVVTAVDSTSTEAPTRDDFCALMTGPRPMSVRTRSGTTFDVGPVRDFYPE